MADDPKPGHILTAKEARSYRWSARKLGWKRRVRQIGRLIRGTR